MVKVTSPHPTKDGHFGANVEVHGNRLIIPASSETDNQPHAGALSLYVMPDLQYPQKLNRVVSPHPIENVNFGMPSVVHGQRMLVRSKSGPAYLFGGGQWHSANMQVAAHSIIFGMMLLRAEMTWTCR